MAETQPPPADAVPQTKIEGVPQVQMPAIEYEEYQETEERLVGNETKFEGQPGYVAPHIETVTVTKRRPVLR